MVLNLRNKILFGNGVVILLLIGVLLWGISNLRILGQASNSILRENYKSIIAAESMIDSVERQDSAVLLVLLGFRIEGTRQFVSNETLFFNWLNQAKNNITIVGEAEILKNLETSYTDYILKFHELSPGPSDDIRSQREIYNNTFFISFNQVRELAINLRDLNQETMYAASIHAEKISRKAIILMSLIGAFIVTLSFVFSFLISMIISKPLYKISQATERIADGNYEINLEVTSKDELGSLAENFNKMIGKVRSYNRLNIGKVIAEKRKIDSLIRSIDDGIIVIDENLIITDMNPKAEEIIGFEFNKNNPKHFLEILNNEKLLDAVKKTIETGSPPEVPQNESIFSTTKFNKERWFLYSITAILSEDNKMQGVVIIIRDITKIKEIDELKDEFIMTASHELKTPVTSIEMSIELLKENLEEKGEKKNIELVHAASDEVSRLKTLIMDLLDLSKLESGKIEMDFTAIDVQDLIEKAYNLFRKQAEADGIILMVEKDANIGRVYADGNKILWVLSNLIANALRYTPKGGTIKIQAQGAASFTYISVSDTGKGIPKEYQAKVFDKFTQLKGTGKPGGAGLGLAISKEIIKAHRGIIWLDSEEGEGSTFTFSLPHVIIDET